MSKEHSDTCFNCGEYKSTIRDSQLRRDPMLCATLYSTEYGPEVGNEYDRHRFVRTEKQKTAEEADELAYYEQMNDFADFVNAEATK